MYYITLAIKKRCQFRGILTILRWFLKLSHSAVAVPHNCRPLIIVYNINNLCDNKNVRFYCFNRRKKQPLGTCLG